MGVRGGGGKGVGGVGGCLKMEDENALLRGLQDSGEGGDYT